MSFMFIQCPWCGETYTWGMVGTSMIGSGHECKARVECAREGCENIATRQVGVGDARPRAGAFELICRQHAIDATVIWGWQPGVFE